ncbi:exodeoxyribonuclease V subunit gamma [Pseudoduganella danionis]|uniref:exodeoxyribonuclease V subunit gamma n=1 Tax=Pseudoduganella danionis TaxID=1890295 RepID=UPI0035AF45EE
MEASVTPGLIVLHGNQLEMLRSAVFQWLRRQPLGALEQEVFLVQSNGVAEWLKIALAEELGICAATRVALPARFLWETYRGMLGHEQVPTISAFDKGPLTWRLMRLLPGLLADPVFAPLRHFLADGAPERRLQLAERLADLYDQYQVYRADWLDDWAHGRDQLRRAGDAGAALALTPEQRWQAQLWRAVIADVAPDQRELGRATIHTEFVRAAAAGEAPLGRLPRRIVIFGVSALPFQTLQALAALSAYTQVLLAVPNPCQYYWGDIIEGRELLRAAHKRQQPRNGHDLGALPLEQLHAHSHPLLASWGRQGRDFIRLLDEFDTASASLRDGDGQPLRVDLFSDGPGHTLLEQIQGAVRDLLPLAEHPGLPPPASDRSVEFHIAHSVQREVEVLHDQLLAMLAADATLRPRDVVVMVPDIDTFTAAIHAVFAQYRRSDARYIPFEIGDVNDRSVNPLLVALEWLLRLPQQRCRQSEVRDLLDVPAVASRYGLDSEDMATLGLWIEGVGVRWGLDPEHRSGLGLGAAGEQNSWLFGVRRMLLGYASGNGAAFGGIEPYGEVGGLDAALAGSLAQLVTDLLHWRGVLAQQRTPAEWGVQARALLAAFFSAGEEGDRLTLAQLDEALGRWLETCENAGFVEAVPLAVLREAWLSLMDEPTLNHQFVSGGVTFCTLMPMRAVPFRVVCLLGMNDGDFPRRAARADFDLLALAGMARPGDRSRRDDDRYLMLEAVLAARDKLYISWVGRNVRDNSPQPPSVLVAQLCDYLRAGWQIALEQLTTEHALQPFSRRYFEQDGLLTYAREWRVAHGEQPAGDAASALAPYELESGHRLKLADLVNFMRQPVRYFFRQRLGVVFGDAAQVGEDEEPFALDGLERYQLEDQLLADEGEDELPEQVAEQLTLRAARLAREGRLPIGLIGQQYQQQLVAGLLPVRSAWLQLRQQYPRPAPKVAVTLALGGLQLEDWVDQLRSDGHGTVWLGQISSKVMDKQGGLRAEKLIEIWLRQLALAASGSPVAAHLIARDAHVQMQPMLQPTALAVLEQLAALWRSNMDQPLPTACKTALALLKDEDARAIYDGGFELAGEVADLCLARLWPEYAELEAQAGFADVAERLYGPLLMWLGTAVTIHPLDQEGAA